MIYIETNVNFKKNLYFFIWSQASHVAVLQCLVISGTSMKKHDKDNSEPIAWF